MGLFSRLSGSVSGDHSSEDCRDQGGHDQRTETRDAGTDEGRTFVYCVRCGWEQEAVV